MKTSVTTGATSRTGGAIHTHLSRLWHSLICGCHRADHRHLWRGWVRLLWPLMSAAALGWFLLRVIPKPIRATYPCQQAAFPLASSLVIWLLGLKTGLLAWLNRRGSLQRRRPALVAGALLCLFVAAALAANDLARYWSGPPVTQTDWTPSDPPNSPMGTAKGIFPGRVVWMRDSSATPWNGGTGHWWDDTTGINQAAVERMLSSSLQALTGTTSDAQAWEAIFRYYNRTHGRGDLGYRATETVAIKINCNNCYSGYGDVDNHVDASPQSVLALLRQLVNQAGVAQGKITVYEATRVVPNRIYNKSHAEFPNVVWVDSQGTGLNGRQPVNRHVNAFTYSATNTGCGNSIPERVFQATYLVNMAQLKGHWRAGVSLTAKNHFGTVTPPNHSVNNIVEAWQRPMGVYHPFVDLMGTRQLGGKTILFLIDGLYGVLEVESYVNAATAAWDNLFGGEWSASYFMSLDPVAIDSVGLDFLRSEFGDRLGTGHNANTDNYLHEAALANDPPSGTLYHPDGTPLASLGVHEHWNNALSKQYSRNLGTGNGIELVQLGVSSRPVVTVEPVSQSVAAGTDVTLSVTAAGTPPLSYQWQHEESNLSDGGHVSGALMPTLALTDVQPADAGHYRVIIHNSAGAVTSAVAVLTVLQPPLILAQPQSGTTPAGSTARMQVLASGATPLKYQWFKDRTNRLTDSAHLSGSATDTLTLTNVLGADGGAYTVALSNQHGTVTSAPALFTVLDPVITGQPASRTNHAGTPAAFTVGAYGTTPAFQWLKAGTPLNGATRSTLTLGAVSAPDATSYSVLVSNRYGTRLSSPATLTVAAPLRIESIQANKLGERITWGSIAGQNYTLQQKGALQEPQWSALLPGVTATGPLVTVTNPLSNPTQRYYRVLLGP